MGFATYMQQRAERSLNEWPKQMEAGRTRWILTNALASASVYVLLVLVTDLPIIRGRPSASSTVGEMLVKLVLVMIGGFAFARSQWKSRNLMYFQRTGDLTAKANADAISEMPGVSFFLFFVVMGLAVAWGWFAEARGSRAPFASALALLALGIAGGFGVYAYRSMRPARDHQDAHLHPGPRPR